MPVQLELPFDDRVKLLIVEDHADTRALLVHYFSSRGYDVYQVQNGREAIQAVERDPGLDVVLLDIFLPEIGGIEVLSEIRRRKPHPSVIVISALTDREIAGQALRLGAFDYIRKPFDLVQLEASVVACLSHSEYQRQHWWKRISA